ncbi:hypothetical protein GE21DRAFT_1289551 [Neurospora crassa]|nr:hypothetical protein GE21DRAFT_1289551 [Neurospora crassa]
MAFGAGLTSSKSYLFFSTLHFLAFALALTVCGLYGVELDRARKADKYADSKWVFAVVVGGLSALTSILFCVPFILRFAFKWVWDFVLFILWVAVFGVFADMYIHEKPEGNNDIRRMKHAVWVDLVNMLLWLVIAVSALAYWFKHRETRSLFTSRAIV